MYHIAICEDDKFYMEQIKGILEKVTRHEGIELKIDTFGSGEELIEAGYEAYDIILLDIKMDGIDGIEVAKEIRRTRKDVHIIFITGIEKYWPEGYVVGAYRYIIKPIEEKPFYEMILEVIKERIKEKVFLLEGDKGLTRVEVTDIEYMVIQKRKVAIHTTLGVYLSSISLKEWENTLKGCGFGQPHASYLVNFRYVRSMTKIKVTLLNGEEVHVSQRKCKEFREAFMQYINEIE